MPDHEKTIDELKGNISGFVRERDWEQFHSPKNLSMAIAIEASELMERFQWVECSESSQILEENKAQIEEEVADIAIFLLNLCALNEIDLSEAICNKLVKNAEKYPVSKAKGKSLKYTEL